MITRTKVVFVRDLHYEAGGVRGVRRLRWWQGDRHGLRAWNNTRLTHHALNELLFSFFLSPLFFFLWVIIPFLQNPSQMWPLFHSRQRLSSPYSWGLLPSIDLHISLCYSALKSLLRQLQRDKGETVSGRSKLCRCPADSGFRWTSVSLTGSAAC